jgi:hypothetical protein
MEEAALGGTVGSSLYLEFINLVCKIFNCLRHHLHLFTTLLLPLTMDSHLMITEQEWYHIYYREHIEHIKITTTNSTSGSSSSSTATGSSSNNSSRNTRLHNRLLESPSRNLAEVHASNERKRRRRREQSTSRATVLKNGAVDMSSVRFTRKYLLEQIRNKFEPGMADNEAEATMRQKVRREHNGATAELVGRVASDQTRQILQNTAPQVKETLKSAAVKVAGTSMMVGELIGGGVMYASHWLKSTVQGSTGGGGGGGGSGSSDGASRNSFGERVMTTSTTCGTEQGDGADADDEWLDVSFKREN